MYGKMTPEEIGKLPPEVQKQINDPQNGLATAKTRYQMENRDKTKPDWFVDEEGNFHQIAVGEEPPSGWKKYEKAPTNESQSNMYYDAAAKSWGTTRDKLSVQQLAYVDAMRARSKAQSSGQTTYQYSTVDPQGNRSTTTRKVSEPIKPPSGVDPLPEKVFSEAPAVSQQSSSASSAIPSPASLSASPKAKKGETGPIVDPAQLGGQSKNPTAQAAQRPKECHQQRLKVRLNSRSGPSRREWSRKVTYRSGIGQLCRMLEGVIAASILLPLSRMEKRF